MEAVRTHEKIPFRSAGDFHTTLRERAERREPDDFALMERRMRGIAMRYAMARGKSRETQAAMRKEAWYDATQEAEAALTCPEMFMDFPEQYGFWREVLGWSYRREEVDKVLRLAYKRQAMGAVAACEQRLTNLAATKTAPRKGALEAIREYVWRKVEEHVRRPATR